MSAVASRRPARSAPTVLVAALSTAFGAGLLAIVELLVAIVSADPLIGGLDEMRLMLGIVSGVFIAISISVAAMVTVNTVATVVAGRTREIALERLLGATAESRRRVLAREGLLAGGIGAVIGIAVGAGVVAVGARVAIAAGAVPDVDAPVLVPAMLPLALAVVLTTWIAAWVGSRRVLDVPPIAALGAAVPAGAEAIRARTGRRVLSVLLVAGGAALLGLAVAIGSVGPEGLLVGVLGGLMSFTGVIAGAVFVVPPVLRGIGALVGRGAAARLGARNAVRSPERSSRAAIGLAIGVTLVTTFVVAGSTLGEMIRIKAEESWGTAEPIDEVLGQMMLVFGVLVGYSAVIAAVGLVNALTVGVLQREREFGLLRALGFGRAQVRATVVVEAATTTVAAVGIGLALGIAYGWVGATSLFIGQLGRPIAPVVPWWLVLGLVVVSAALTIAASLVPAARASRVAPVVALAA